MRKISVIIPVYNSEKTLVTTLDSLYNQSDNDFEIVVVNDGSRGNCDEIVEEYRKKLPNILYKKHEKNKGLLLARETGARTASGDYILNLDADDTLSPNLIEELKYTLSNNEEDIDIVLLNLMCVLSGESQRSKWHDRGLGEYREKKGLEAFINRSLSGWGINKLYKRELCLKVYDILSVSASLIMGEDSLFAMCFFSLSEHIVCCKEGYYFYHIDTPSTTRRAYDSTYINWHYHQIELIVYYLKKFCADQKINPDIFRNILFELAGSFLTHIEDNNEREKIELKLVKLLKLNKQKAVELQRAVIKPDIIDPDEIYINLKLFCFIAKKNIDILLTETQKSMDIFLTETQKNMDIFLTETQTLIKKIYRKIKSIIKKML